MITVCSQCLQMLQLDCPAFQGLPASASLRHLCINLRIDPLPPASLSSLLAALPIL